MDGQPAAGRGLCRQKKVLAKGDWVTLNLFNGVIVGEKLKLNDFKHPLGFG